MPRAKPHAWLEVPGVRDALSAGKSNAAVAAIAGVCRQTVDLYKRSHLKPALDTAIKARAFDNIAKNLGVPPDQIRSTGALAKAALEATPFLARADWLWEKCRQNVEKAEDAVSVVRGENGEPNYVASDLSAVAPLLNQAHRNLELFGRHTGALTDGAVGNVTNVVLMLPNESRAPEHQGDTLEACVVADDDTST